MSPRLGEKRERQISQNSHSTPSKTDPFGNTWCSGNTGDCDSGGWGNNGDRKRSYWSSTSTRGGLEGGELTRTPTGWPTGWGEGLDWSSSKAGTRGVWGGDYDWSSSSTRGAELFTPSAQTGWPTGEGGGRLDWSHQAPEGWGQGWTRWKLSRETGRKTVTSTTNIYCLLFTFPARLLHHLQHSVMVVTAGVTSSQ